MRKFILICGIVSGFTYAYASEPKLEPKLETSDYLIMAKKTRGSSNSYLGKHAVLGLACYERAANKECLKAQFFIQDLDDGGTTLFPQVPFTEVAAKVAQMNSVIHESIQNATNPLPFALPVFNASLWTFGNALEDGQAALLGLLLVTIPADIVTIPVQLIGYEVTKPIQKAILTSKLKKITAALGAFVADGTQSKPVKMGDPMAYDLQHAFEVSR